MIPHRRDHPIAISAEAVALAWARTEDAPSGATVVVGQEISPRGFHGRLWTAGPERTVAMAVVVRPDVPVQRADGMWLVAALATADAIEVNGGRSGSTWWPSALVDAEGTEMAMTKVQVHLGVGGVEIGVVTVRIDLMASGLALRDRTPLTEAVQDRLIHYTERLQGEPDLIATDYGSRSALTARSVRIDLLPNGLTRGKVRGFGPGGELLLGTADACDPITVEALRDLQLADR